MNVYNKNEHNFAISFLSQHRLERKREEAKKDRKRERKHRRKMGRSEGRREDIMNVNNKNEHDFATAIL